MLLGINTWMKKKKYTWAYTGVIMTSKWYKDRIIVLGIVFIIAGLILVMSATL